MKSNSAGTVQRVRLKIVIGALALAPPWLLPLRADKAAGSGQGLPPDKRQTTDTHGLEALLRAQQVVVRKAEAEYYIARLACEIAEIEIRQYIEFTFPRELATADAKIKRAESDLKRAEDRLDRRRNNSYKGFPPLPATTDELGVKKTRFALEQALSEKKVLAEFTKGRKTRALKAEVDKARAVERAKQRAWEIEKSKQSAIEHQVAQWQAVIVQRGKVKRSPSRSVGDTFSGDA